MQGQHRPRERGDRLGGSQAAGVMLEPLGAEQLVANGSEIAPDGRALVVPEDVTEN